MGPKVRPLAAQACALLCAAALATAARADVLTLKNNKVMKGIVEEEDATSVRFMQAGATIKIPRANIKTLDKESKAQGLTHIGEDLRQQNKLDDAAKFFQQALAQDANFKPAKDGLKAVDDAKAQKNKAMRQDVVQGIEGLIAKVKESIRKGEFDKCEKLLKEASDLNPNPEQKPELRKLVTELYIAWSKDYLDRFDKGNAEAKLNIALAAEPENEEVVELLLKLWEGQPGKKEEIIKIYETVLQKKPDDQTLRRKIGDLHYELNQLDRAVYNYLEIYKSSETYKKSALRDRIVDTLEKLHAENAAKKDFDQAIYYYDLLATVDPNTDPTARIYYEFLKMANQVKPEDVEGRIALAEFAEKNGMEQEMLDAYFLALKKDPENKKAKDGVDRYAMGLVAQAQANFNQQEWYTAKALADQVVKAFPGSREAAIKANEILQASNNEIDKDRRQNREKALLYVKRGDTYYEQAMASYDRMINTQYNNPGLRVSSPKSDAIRYFRSAIQSYQAALQIDPSLKDDPGQFVAPRLTESQQFLNRLSGGPPAYRKNYGRVIGPNPNYNINEGSSDRR